MLDPEQPTPFLPPREEETETVRAISPLPPESDWAHAPSLNRAWQGYNMDILTAFFDP